MTKPMVRNYVESRGKGEF